MTHQVWLIARRSIVRTSRQPGTWIPPLTFPLMLMAVNSNGLRAATHLPGFPTNSFVAFALAVPFIQGALFATMNAGTDLARDIQTGFLSRLSLTPMRRLAVLGGQLGGVVTLGLLQALVYVGVGLIIGVRLASGAAGLVVADTLSRTLLAPTEIPVGVLTVLIGGPAFVLLYRRHRAEVSLE